MMAITKKSFIKSLAAQVIPAALVFLVATAPVFGVGFKQLHGHVPEAVKHLQPIGNLPATNELHLAIGVQLRDPAGLDRFLADIYNSSSPNYRHFLTPEEFTARFSATEADYAAVENFALTNGFKITGTPANRLLLDVTARVADVDRAFHLHLKKFKHPIEPREFFAPDLEPTVDAVLPVLDVQGLSDFVRPHPKSHKIDPNTLAAKGGSAPDGSGEYFGNDFRNAYVPGTTLTGAGQMVGLFQLDGFYSNDIATYAQQADGGRLNIQVQPVMIGDTNWSIGVNGGNTEVSLDIEMAMAMAPGLSKILVFEDSSVSDVNTILDTMAASNMVKSLSCSWGWGNGPSDTTDNIFKTMAAQGQSFFNASGDTDAFTLPADTSANGVDNPNLANAPSSSPYITQVGGTTLTTGTGASYTSETVWNVGSGSGSSGGVSSYYSIPYWQTNIDMTANLGSTANRNIPDVALTADNVYVISGGNAAGGGVGGTSCAAPLWAGFMALVNQQAAMSDDPPVGLINPAVYAIGEGKNPAYSYAACFHDITTGNNFWPSSPSQYPATTGYDLCTGWGTPNGTALIDALAPADPLVIMPFAGFTAAGPVNGPFSGVPQTLTLTNTGANSLSWRLSNIPSWFSVSISSGTLAAGKQTNVTVNLTALASSLAAGTYGASMVFSNQTTHVAQPRQFTLFIGQSLVQNGGFETGDFTGWTLTGDTTSGGTLYNGVVDSSFTTSAGVSYVHSGTYGAVLGESGLLATLSQSFPTFPGQTYLLSFWLINPTNLPTQIFEANWNTSTLYGITNPPVFSWMNPTFVVTAASTSSTLEFAAEDDQDYFGLDDVSLTPIPKPSFTALAKTANSLTFTWNSLASVSYLVQYKTNLLQANWINLSTNTAVGGTTSFTNAIGTDPRRFYRIRQLP